MKVPIYRMFVMVTSPFGNAWPFPAYLFEPHHDNAPMPDPFVSIEAPEGSRLEPIPDDPDEMDGLDWYGEDNLFLALPDGEHLSAGRAFWRFGEPGLVQSEADAIKESLDGYRSDLDDA